MLTIVLCCYPSPFILTLDSYMWRKTRSHDRKCQPGLVGDLNECTAKLIVRNLCHSLTTSFYRKLAIYGMIANIFKAWKIQLSIIVQIQIDFIPELWSMSTFWWFAFILRLFYHSKWNEPMPCLRPGPGPYHKITLVWAFPTSCELLGWIYEICWAVFLKLFDAGLSSEYKISPRFSKDVV